MEIIRVPKSPDAAPVARLTLSKSANGRIQAIFKIDGPLSAFMEHAEYGSVGEAESVAAGYAEQRKAICLIIEDRS